MFVVAGGGGAVAVAAVAARLAAHLGLRAEQKEESSVGRRVEYCASSV